MLNQSEQLHIRENNGLIAFYHTYKVRLKNNTVITLGTTHAFKNVPMTEERVIETVLKLEEYTRKKKQEVVDRYGQELGWQLVE